MQTEASAARRVAVVVVHGVADQKPGETASSVVELLVASAPAGTSYEAVGSEAYVLEVPPLAPAIASRRESPPTRSGNERPFFKALVQSGRSDFQRAGWEAPTTLAAARGRAPPAAPGVIAARAAVSTTDGPDALEDRGLAATSYLLGKYIENGAEPEAFASTRIDLEREGKGGARERVEVFEMYWADLSRLSGAIPRIVTELFTMVFRLSKLGRETVDEARRRFGGATGRPPASWRGLAATQIALDWAFVNGLAALYAQLGLIAILLLLFGAAWPFEAIVGTAVGIAALLFAVLWWRYRHADSLRRQAVPGLLGLAALSLLAVPASTSWILALGLLILVSAAYDAALRIADDRFPLVRVVGLVFWSITLALVAGAALWRVAVQGASPGLAVWVQASLLAAEFALWGIKLWWVAVAPIFIAWLFYGFAAARHGGYVGAASVGTGRLGFFVSLGTFVMLTVASWALLSTPLEAAVRQLGYLPALFPVGEVTSGHSDASLAAASCLINSNATLALVTPAVPPSTAQLFLSSRYQDNASFFSPVAVLLLLLVAYLVAIFLPSVLAELKLLVAPAIDAIAARRLGRWLTAGYRRLDRAVLAVVVLAAVLAPLVVYVLIFGRAGPLHSVGSSELTDCLAYASQTLLKPLVLSAAGIAAALAALGGLLSRYLPGLRAPLDIALDIDNYFREFPRRSIPRARIFSRYAALLDHIATRGYERVVVVSHSQGTVISAELLRFLSQPGDRDAAVAAPAERLRDKLGCDVRLLTLGCPLRQLYAARFPSLYGWILAGHAGGNGPQASDIGVERWANAFTSGDYVGRWLWSSPRWAGDAIGEPMVDTVQPATFGRTDAYAPFDPMPPAVHPLASARELEVCLGAGAHTHYFEPNQASVAWLIDHLIASPRL